MPIKIQILFHIHENSIFFPTLTQVAFNATVLAQILQDSVFSWICLERKISKSSQDY